MWGGMERPNPGGEAGGRAGNGAAVRRRNRPRAGVSHPRPSYAIAIERTRDIRYSITSAAE